MAGLKELLAGVADAWEQIPPERQAKFTEAVTGGAMLFAEALKVLEPADVERLKLALAPVAGMAGLPLMMQLMQQGPKAAAESLGTLVESTFPRVAQVMKAISGDG